MTAAASRPTLFRIFLLVSLPLLAYFLSWYYNGQTISLLSGSMAALLVWGAVSVWPRLNAGLPWPRGFLPVFMLLWVIWLWLTLFWSGVPYSSWFYFWVLGSLPLGFLFWVLMPEEDARAVWPWVWAGILAGAWVLSLMALWEYFSTMDHGGSGFLLRVKGPLLDTNSFAAWMNLLYFPVLGRFLYLDGRSRAGFFSGKVDPARLFYLLTLLFLGFAFWATYSRGGTLSWICTLLVALVVFRRIPRFRSNLLLLTGITAACYAIFGYLHHYDMLGHLAPAFVTANLSTVSRGLMWLATWHMFLDHPWQGTGIGSYFLFYPAYRLPGELGSAGTYAHNDYIEFLAEGGIANLGFLLVFASVLFYSLYRVLFSGKIKDPLAEEGRYQAAGLILGVFAITGHALGNFIFYNLPLGLLAGILLGQAWRRFLSSGETEPVLPRLQINHPSFVQGALVLLWAVAIWYLVLDGAVYALFSSNGWLDSVIPGKQARAVFLMKAANFLVAARPQATQPHVYLGNAYQNLAARDKNLDPQQHRVLIRAALSEYRQSLVGIPRQPGVLKAMGSLYLEQGQFLGLNPQQSLEKALLSWRRALAYEPESVSLRSEIAQNAFFREGNTRQGIAFLEAGLERPLFPEARSLLEWVIAEKQWTMAHDPEAAVRTLAGSLRKNPDFTPNAELIRQIGILEKRRM